MDEIVAFMDEKVSFMDEKVLIMDENRSVAGPSGTPSGAAAACRNVHCNVRNFESAGNTGFSDVR